MMSTNSQTNGASLEDCHTNFFALVSVKACFVGRCVLFLRYFMCLEGVLCTFFMCYVASGPVCRCRMGVTVKIGLNYAWKLRFFSRLWREDGILTQIFPCPTLYFHVFSILIQPLGLRACAWAENIQLRVRVRWFCVHKECYWWLK